MFTTFDHTADLGLRVHAASREALFAEAALALASILVERPAALPPADADTIQLAGTALDLLLFDWLNELLFRFETRQELVVKAVVQFTNTGLDARVATVPLAPEHHRPDHEVKAITYHGLCVKQEPDGTWLAEVIVDI